MNDLEIMSELVLHDVLRQLNTAATVAESIFEHTATLESEVLQHNELQFVSLQTLNDCEDMKTDVPSKGLHLGAVR